MPDGFFNPRKLASLQTNILQDQVRIMNDAFERVTRERDAAIALWQQKHCLHCPAFGRCHDEPVVNCSPENIRALFLDQVRRA